MIDRCPSCGRAGRAGGLPCMACVAEPGPPEPPRGAAVARLRCQGDRLLVGWRLGPAVGTIWPEEGTSIRWVLGRRTAAAWIMALAQSATFCGEQ